MRDRVAHNTLPCCLRLYRGEYDVKPWQNLHRWQRLQTINTSYIQSLQSKDLHIPPDRLLHTKNLTEIIDLIYYRTELESRGEVGSLIAQYLN